MALPRTNVLTEGSLLAELAWLQRLARSLVNDLGEAEDLAQDTVKAALEAPPQVSGGGIRPWLATVARNLAATRRRAAARRSRREAKATSTAPATPVEAARRTELFRDLAQAVVELPDPYRETVLLCFYQGRSARQASKELGISVEALRTRRKRAVGMLRQRMTQSHGAGALLALVPGAAAAPVSVGALLASKAGLLLPAAAALLLGAVGWLLFETKPPAAPGAGLQAAPPSLASEASRLPAVAPSGTVLAAAQVRTPVATPAQTGVQVLLVREGGEEPVAGATVQARFAPEVGRSTTVEVVTDLDGNCWLELPAGPVIWLRSLRLGLVPGAVAGGSRFPEAFTLEEGQTREITLLCPEPATVTGSVVDETGRPVAGAEIAAYEGGPDPASPWPPALKVETDSAGNFHIEGLHGETTLAARKGGRWGDQWLEVDLRSSQFLEGMRFQLVPARPLKVTVQDERGKPLAGASVHCIPHQRQLFSDGGMGPTFLAPSTGLLVTEADGIAMVPHRGRDAYRLSVEHPDMVRREFRDLDPELSEMVVVLRELAQFRGRVLGPNGNPVAGARVGLLHSRFTDAEGWFRLPFREQPRQRQGGPLPPRKTFPVQAEGHAYAVVPHPDPADSFPLVVVLEAEAVLEGRLVSALGKGVAGAFIRLDRAPWERRWIDFTGEDGGHWSMPPAPNWTEGASFREWLLTDAEGRFRLRGLPADLFRLRFYRDEKGPLLAVVEHRSDGEPITVRCGDGLQEFRSIRGRVSNSATGQALTWAVVRAPSRGFAFRDASAAYTDPDGSFFLAGLASGEVRVSIRKEGFALLDFTLDGGGPAAVERDFVLHPLCPAQLRILDAHGEPASGAQIRFRKPEGGILQAVTQGGPRSLHRVDSKGELELQGAPGGKVLLHVLDQRRELIGEFALDWTVPPEGVVELRLPGRLGK